MRQGIMILLLCLVLTSPTAADRFILIDDSVYVGLALSWVDPQKELHFRDDATGKYYRIEYKYIKRVELENGQTFVFSEGTRRLLQKKPLPITNHDSTLLFRSQTNQAPTQRLSSDVVKTSLMPPIFDYNPQQFSALRPPQKSLWFRFRDAYTSHKPRLPNMANYVTD